MRFVALLFVWSFMEALEHHWGMKASSEKGRETMAGLCVLMLILDIVELLGAL